MQQWEYLVVFIEDDETHQDNASVDVYLDADRYTEKLNNYGGAGWELVAFDWADNGGKATFKRPKSS